MTTFTDNNPLSAESAPEPAAVKGSDKTYQHVANYPAIEEVTSWLSQWELFKFAFKTWSTFLHTTINYINSFDRLASYWTQLDSLLDSWLSFFDKTFPTVANFSYSSTYDSIFKSVDKRISALNRVAESALKSLDPILKYTNDYYEYVLNLVLPSTSKLNLNLNPEYSEYQRGWSLIKETFNRIHIAASGVSKIPTHVTETYKNEAKETKSTTEAVTNTTRKLSNDAYQSIKPTFDRVIGLNSASNPIEDLSEIKDNISRDVANATGVEVR